METNTLSYWITMFRYKTSLFILCQHKHPSFDEAKECLLSTSRTDPDSFIAQVQEQIKPIQQEVTAFNLEGQRLEGTYYHWKSYESDFDLLGHPHIATDLSLEQCRNKVDTLEQENKEYRAKLKLERKQSKTKAKAQALGATPQQQVEQQEQQTQIAIGEVLNNIEQSNSCLIENVTGEKCKKCNNPIIFCCDSIGKLEGKTILLGHDRCSQCGLLPIPKKQKQLYRKISAKMTNIRKLRSSQVTKLSDGELAVMS